MEKPTDELKKLVDQEDAAPARNEAPSASKTREEMLALLRSAVNKHFVFFFGMPNSGKTAVLGAMLRAMQEADAFGKVFIVEDEGDGSGVFRRGLQLWHQIQDSYSAQRFPARTVAGRTIQLFARFQPHRSEEILNLVFLEMGGEDLRQVAIVGPDGERGFPIHIDQFLRIPSLRMVFVITTSWRNASEDDSRINAFLDYLQEKDSDLLQNRIILLITKWDTNPRREPVWRFVTRELPNTYNKLRNPKNLIGTFSIGHVIPAERGKEHPDDIIDQFAHYDARIVFDRILETFTGRSFLKRRSFWSFLRIWRRRHAATTH